MRRIKVAALAAVLGAGITSMTPVTAQTGGQIGTSAEVVASSADAPKGAVQVTTITTCTATACTQTTTYVIN